MHYAQTPLHRSVAVATIHYQWGSEYLGAVAAVYAQAPIEVGNRVSVLLPSLTD